MKVVFRKFTNTPQVGAGDVIALFCGSAKDCSPGNVMSYTHVGQHGEASRTLGQNLKLATPEEYAPLLRELSAIYGFITPVSRLVA